MMFDWKRSTKVVDVGASPGINGKPNMKCWNRYGRGAYSALPDCSFVHYSLQQAMYKRILAKNYGISIDRTFLRGAPPAIQPLLYRGDNGRGKIHRPHLQQRALNFIAVNKKFEPLQ